MSLIPSPFSRLASATVSGLVGTGPQTYAGDKTHTGKLISTVTGAASVAIPQDGYLSLSGDRIDRDTIHGNSTALNIHATWSNNIFLRAGEVKPWTDNTQSLGTAALRWADLRSNAGTFSGALTSGSLTTSGSGNIQAGGFFGSTGSVYYFGAAGSGQVYMASGGVTSYRIGVGNADRLFVETSPALAMRPAADNAMTWGTTTMRPSVAHAYKFLSYNAAAVGMAIATNGIFSFNGDVTNGCYFQAPNTNQVYFGAGNAPMFLVDANAPGLLPAGTTNTKVFGSDAARWKDLFVGTLVYLGKIATGSIPAASSGNEGALLYDSTVKKLKFSTGSAWETVTSA